MSSTSCGVLRLITRSPLYYTHRWRKNNQLLLTVSRFPEGKTLYGYVCAHCKEIILLTFCRSWQKCRHNSRKASTLTKSHVLRRLRNTIRQPAYNTIVRYLIINAVSGVRRYQKIFQAWIFYTESFKSVWLFSKCNYLVHYLNFRKSKWKK